MQNPPKHPPHSIDAEMSVLGGMMLDNGAGFEVLDTLREVDFYLHAHQLIFTAMRDLLSAHKPCDFLTVTEALRYNNKLEEAGGVSYIGTLANDTPSAANTMAYAEIVRERSVLRQLISTGQGIADIGFRPEGRTASVLLEEAEQKVFALRQGDAKGKVQYHSMPPLLDHIAKTLEDAKGKPGGRKGLLTGFRDFDSKTNGLHPGDLVIVAGRPGMGKTSFAMNIAEHVAIETKQPVAVFSMEMAAEQLVFRVLSSFGGIDQQNLRNAAMDDTEWDRLASAIGLMREAPLFIDETGALSPLELRARARRIAARHGLSLIVVDYIQLMQVPGSDNRANEVAEISRSLKALGKELSVPVIALSQLNRGVEQRDNKRPRMADLRESGGIEQDADVVVFVYRDDYYNPETSPDKGQAELIIAKQRSGPTGMVKVGFEGRYTKFRDLADSSYAQY
ncbi:replicative DNA helicase [Solimonas sp. K1W22B-7]|uniref:replicative DNA helicase n=1 Tax=Solimonas sp. K1W22B-7 TaxID=2303331 RepID=UPI000E334F73|nr:replicative DNA helicase [Solimonas sp. K1W22B-7]AXQ31726.1 replicative DNA helicase [Solimonas sp. K1W22B-7]